MDSGQGFLKVTVNVFNPQEKILSDSELDNTGVKRSFLIAIVEGVSEANGNLWKLIEPLNLQDVKYYFAFDLKCANSVFGISSHAGKYSPALLSLVTREHLDPWMNTATTLPLQERRS